MLLGSLKRAVLKSRHFNYKLHLEALFIINIIVKKDK